MQISERELGAKLNFYQKKWNWKIGKIEVLNLNLNFEFWILNNSGLDYVELLNELVIKRNEIGNWKIEVLNYKF